MRKLNALIKYWFIICFCRLSCHIGYAQNLNIGDTIPNFKFHLVNNEELEFYQINDGYVFINFWASWNNESRRINRELLPIYSRYREKRFKNGVRRFNILSVSIDNDKSYFELALKKDNPSWTYKTCDFLGWNSPLVKLLNIKRIPANFLIEPGGRIIGKNLTTKELDLLLRSL